MKIRLNLLGLGVVDSNHLTLIRDDTNNIIHFTRVIENYYTCLEAGPFF